MQRIRAIGKIIDSKTLVNCVTDDRIVHLISDLFNQAGVAATILFNDNPQGGKKNDPDYVYALRLERVKYVEELLAAENVEVSILKDRDLRNSLTHIDEHLAKALTQDEQTSWWVDVCMDMTEKWEIPGAKKVQFCRCLDFKTGHIIHLNHDVDIGTLLFECLIVLRVIFGIDENRIPSPTP